MPFIHRHLRSYVHNGRVGVLVEFGCNSDFTVRTEEFNALAEDVALQIAALAPEDVRTLYAQPAVKNSALTVGQLIQSAAATLQERIDVTRFIRWTADEYDAPQGDPPKVPGVIMAFRRPSAGSS